MKLHEIQPTAKTLLEAVSVLASKGVPVLLDDGTYPKIPARETALASPGLVLIVTPPQSKGLDGDVARSGVAKHRAGVHVIVEVSTWALRLTSRI